MLNRMDFVYNLLHEHIADASGGEHPSYPENIGSCRTQFYESCTTAVTLFRRLSVFVIMNVVSIPRQLERGIGNGLTGRTFIFLSTYTLIANCCQVQSETGHILFSHKCLARPFCGLLTTLSPAPSAATS